MPFGTFDVGNESVPVFAPTYPYSASSFTNTSIVGVYYRVSAAQIVHLVPSVLDLEDEPLMTSLFLDYGMSTVGVYTEYVHQVEVTYQGEKFDYNLILLLDNEAATFAGRELYGFPKVLGKANIDTHTGGRLIIGNAQRPIGRNVVEFEFIPQSLLEALPPREKWMLNLRNIPSPFSCEKPPIQELVPCVMDMKASEVWVGEGRVTFPRTSALDPWANIDVLRYEGAFFGKGMSAKLLTRDKAFKL